MRLRPEHDFKLLTSLADPRDSNDYGVFCSPSGCWTRLGLRACGYFGMQRETLLHCYITLDYDTLPTFTAESSGNVSTYELPDGNILTVGAKTLPLRGSVVLVEDL